MYLINAIMLLPKGWFRNNQHNLIPSTLFLIAVFFNIVAVSTAGTEVNFPAAEIVRNSIGFDSNFQEVPANHGRYENICIASTPEITIYSDGPARLALKVDGNQVLCETLVVETTTDGEYFNTICNTYSDEPFVSHRIPQDFITNLEVLPDGSWILALGSPFGPNQQGNLFRSTDKGQTWIWVKQFEIGYPIGSQWYAVADNEVAIGEYGYRPQSNNARRVYYSDDYGATWSKIYEPAPEPNGHVHVVAFKPGDTNNLYVAYGDDEAAKVIKLQYTPGPGGKKDPNNWSKTANSPIYISNPATGFSDGRYLYWGHDGSFVESVIWRLDPIDDTIKNVLDWPQYKNSDNSPYQQLNSRGEVRSMCLYDGVYYAPVTQADGSAFRVGGIYVSVDGEHWVAAYRVGQSASGFYKIVGYANGYLWGTAWMAYGSRFYKMKPVNAEMVEALRIEKGVNNIFNSPADSSFEGSIGRWSMEGDIDDVNSGISADCNLHGSSSFKVICLKKGYNYTAVYSGKWSDMGGNPSVGDYVCASFWIKGASTWPAKYGYSYADISITGGGSIGFYASYFTVVDDWQKVTIWGRCTSPITGYVKLRIYLNNNYGYQGDYSDATCYIDCAQVTYGPDLHNSGSWQIGGTPRDNEYAYQNITGLGRKFTTTFEWRPEIASREWHGGRISIASWRDNFYHIDLYYDVNSSKFVASDGLNTVTTVKNYGWEHLDSIKFSLANEIVDFNLCVASPLLGQEQITSSGTLLGRPVEVRFGTDFSGTGYGSGLIADVNHFDEGAEPNLPGDLTGNGIVNFADFAVFADRWLESGCGEPDWCQGADLDKNSVVDWSDLVVLCNNWLEEVMLIF